MTKAMCRLFAQLSPVPESARYGLVDAKFSLLRQSDFKADNKQQDGWGIGWLGSEGPVVAKSPRAAFRDAARVTAAADRALSTAVIGHIRAASNPRGLARSRIINMANTQPFSDGQWVFAHNGTLEIPLAVAAELGPWRKHVKSNNDSEVYFWQFRKFLDKLGDGALAFEACVRETWAVWRALPEKLRRKPTPYTSLNALATDGRRLFAFCHAARRGLADCGVCNPTQPWGTMSFARRGKALIVASENLDGRGWTRLSPPETLSAEVSAGAVKMTRTRYELGPRGLERVGTAEAAVR